MIDNRTEDIIRFAETVEAFTAAQYAQTLEPNVSLHSIVNILNRMVRQGKIQRLQRGVYTKAKLNVWHVVFGEQEKAVYDLIHTQFPLLKLCVYNGETLSPLQHHLAYNQATYVEVDREGVEPVFHCLQDAGYEVYRMPDAQMMYDYADIKKKIVIVKPLVTQAPLMKQKGYYVPMLEKILVDIHADKDFFYMQGIEASYMTENARSLYMLNEEKLQRYAKRRNIKIWLQRNVLVKSGLHDVGRLFEHVDDMHITAEVFRRIVPIELAYRELTMTVEEVIDGIRRTDMNIALRGALNAEQFAFLQRGIMKMRNFMYSGRQYRIDEAIIDAARDAYMLTLIEQDVDQMEKYSGDPMSVASLSIEGLEMNKLNKLKKNFPEAFWYWHKTSELLKK